MIDASWIIEDRETGRESRSRNVEFRGHPVRQSPPLSRLDGPALAFTSQQEMKMKTLVIALTLLALAGCSATARQAIATDADGHRLPLGAVPQSVCHNCEKFIG